MMKNFNAGKGNRQSFGKAQPAFDEEKQRPTFDGETETDEANRPEAPTFGEGNDESERPEPPTFGGHFDRKFWGGAEDDLSNDELLADNNFAKPNDLGEILGTENRFEISLGFGENNFGGGFAGFGGMNQPTFGGGRNFAQNQPQQQK